MVVTLGHAYVDPLIIDAVGSCNQEQIRNAVNEAQHIFALSVNRDEQKETIKVLVFDGCFCLPRQYDKILHAYLGNSCGGAPLTLRSINYEFLEDGNQFSRGLGKNIIFRGKTPIFRKPSFPRFHIFAISEKTEKPGSVIVVQGLEGNHTEVFTGSLQNATFQPGEKLPISRGQVYRTCEEIRPCDESELLGTVTITREQFSDITAILKRDAAGLPYKSNGYVYVYALCPETKAIQMVSYLHPYDTEAEFSSYYIPGIYFTGCHELILQVTKKFVPAYHPDDVLFVQNIPALAAMIRSERARRANEIELANYELSRANILMEGKERRFRKNEQRVLRTHWQRGLKAFR
jgi:hypothetical protein